MVARQPFEQRMQRFRRVAIEVARRLVGEHDLRRVHQRPGNRHALLFAPRQLPRLVLPARFQAHGSEQFTCTPERLRALLGGAFFLESERTYSKFFSELVDTAIHWAVERTGKRSSAKGMVVTRDDLAKNRKLFRFYSLVYPAVWAVTRLDALVPASGYMLIACARRSPDATRSRS